MLILWLEQDMILMFVLLIISISCFLEKKVTVIHHYPTWGLTKRSHKKSAHL